MKQKIMMLAALIAVIQFLNINPIKAQYFAVIGDYGDYGGNGVHAANVKAVADMIKFNDPEFIITVGDNNYTSGEYWTLCRNITQNYYPFIDPNYTAQDLVDIPCFHRNPETSSTDGPEHSPYPNYTGIDDPNTRFYPSPGNHDYRTDDATPYYFYFNNIPRYYDFVRGDVHFFSINSNAEEPDGNGPNSVQANWLKSKLQASTAKWKIVYFHHVAYSSGSHGDDSDVPDHRWDYKEWGATAVITGHDHHYERLNADCLPYFINGLGGTSIRNIGPPIPESQFAYNDKHGAMFINADANKITFEFYAVSESDPAGELIDSYTIDDLYPYTNCGEDPPPAICCPEGSTWDGAHCYFNIHVPDGYDPFIWNNGLYTHYGPLGPGDCPPGSVDDGAHCYFQSFPSFYDGFILDNKRFYAHANCEAEPEQCCPAETTWDGSNCHYDIAIPDGYVPFIGDDNGLYVEPDPLGNCPPGTTVGKLGCYLGTTIPLGLDGFIYKGEFYVHEDCDLYKCCPEGTEWNGEACELRGNWENANLVILSDNSIAIVPDPVNGCPPNTTPHPLGLCLTGLSVPRGFEGTVNGDVIEIAPNCYSCCPEGYEFDGTDCVKNEIINGSNVTTYASTENCLEDRDKVIKRQSSSDQAKGNASLSITDAKVRIYPNPALHMINIEATTEGETEQHLVRIFDQLGKVVLERGFEQHLKLDIQFLSPGLHFVKIMDRDGKLIGVEKLVVSR